MTADRTTAPSPRPSWEQLLAHDPRRAGALLDAIYRHAADDYPNECCGFVHASGKLHRAVNGQDALHAQDPAQWPRSARSAYSLAPDDLFQFGASLAGPDPAIVVYHSHPDVGAYFSAKDAADALHDGKPVYDVDFLVIDVRQGRVHGAKLFRFVDAAFVCVWSETI